MSSQRAKAGGESALYHMTKALCVVCVCVNPTLDFFGWCSVCVFVNPHYVTQTHGIAAGVRLFTVSLVHSICNPEK